ncbi:hypothetical protein PIB30_098352 [Stylosanthes scabra]|uniref:Spermidine hydroxycinnamoyl transferase n=1 Tax=Stylosanthes scabra TaxID=79078 RepID=A0ABU6TZL6_9FABA|nr:hypothetical protein [Stylosanthes scabra]
MVAILASYTVTPKEETPKGFLWLSDNDQLWRWSHTPLLYIYKPNHNNVDVHVLVETMRGSLGQILVHYYPLAGRLSWTKGCRLELDCNAKGAVLLEAESTKSAVELGDFSPNNESVKELIPTVDYSRPIEELPLFVAQVTRFHGSNVIAIGILWSHPLGDGSAAIHFINSWAKLTQGRTINANELPFLDRTVLKPPSHQPSRRFDHREFKPLPLVLGKTDNIEEQKKKTTFAQLKLTPIQVQKLRKNANKNAKSQRQYTRFEVIGAYIWRCASKARRELKENQPTAAKLNVNIRNRLNPPLPERYFGNALAPTVTPTCYVGDIISRPLSYTTQKIREAVERVSSNEYLRSQMDFIAKKERWDSIRTPYLERGEYRADVPFFGNPNIILGSWMSMPAYEADFGWGKPLHFGPGAVCPYDRAMISLRPQEEDSHGVDDVVVFLHFQEAYMQDFIKFFWEDIRESSCSTQAKL